MKAILINNLRRLWLQKQLLILLVIFTAAAVTAAIFVSTSTTQTWDVAVVSDVPMEIESENVNLIPVPNKPSQADLVSGQYDAILTINPDGSYALDTIKSQEVTNQLLAALEGRGEDSPLFSSRGTGTNVLGFLMMFILLMGSVAMSMYADDKTYAQITRIAASPIKMETYLLSYSIFNFSFLFFPTLLILSLIQWITGVSLHYSFGTLSILIAILCALATTFSLMLYSVFFNKADSVKMAGSSLIILTSVLAGSFYAFEKGNPILEQLISILPQKAYLMLAQGLEQKAEFLSFLPSLVYLLILITLFYCISVVTTKRAYINQH